MISLRSRVNQISSHIFGKPKSRKCVWQTWLNRKFSSNTTEKPPNLTDPSASAPKPPPLSEPLPGVPKPVYSTAKNDDQKTQVTTLPNGLRVASENRFGQFCTIGVVVDSGSRYEAAYPSGISHFLEKLAFNSTTHFSDKDKILYELEKYGGICDCQSSRDIQAYAASAERGGLDAVVRVLGDIILRPQLTETEVSIARQTVQFELESLLMRPEQETILMDMIHAAAYRDNTLGFPKICPAENVDVINRQILFAYLKQHYTPKRMVVAGVGIEHDKLVESVNKYFVEQKPIWVENESLLPQGKMPDIDDSIAQYTGGVVKEQCEIPQHAGPSGLPELAHIVIGLEGCSHQDPDFIPVCVLNMMMGGGGSFSAGGPGKGMYTRLYTNVLNRYEWMFSATQYNHAYADTGLFCIHASAPPANVKEMVQVILQEMIKMAGEICPIELRRAKTQLQSLLLMNLESRAVVFEDIARQVLSTGHRKTPEHFMNAIEQITEEDIQRVAKKLLNTRLSLAARGDIRKLPPFEDIENALVDMEGKSKSKKGRLLLF